MSVFVRSYCSGFVKLIVEYWSISDISVLCTFTLIEVMFSKTSVFVPFSSESV